MTRLVSDALMCACVVVLAWDAGIIVRLCGS